MLKPTIQILLATYNGATYIQEQLNSIYAQSFTDWQILVKDDGSKDETLTIIKKNKAKYPEKIVLLPSGKGGNSSENFFALMTNATANYIAFCDQDDCWIPNKLEISLAKLKELEKITPECLVFTDMQVVDENLNEISPSFMKAQRLKEEWLQNHYNVFSQSLAAGCTMLFTKKLADKIYPINTALFQHDHWVLLHASYYGEVKFIDKATVLYRQHTSNAIGSHEINSRYFKKKAVNISILWQRWNYLKRAFGKDIKRRNLLYSKISLSLKRVLNA